MAPQSSTDPSQRDPETDRRFWEEIQGHLGREIERAIGAVEAFLRGDDPGALGSLSGYSESYRHKLAILRGLVETHDSVILPALSAEAPLGHAYPAIEQGLGLSPGAGIEILEDLADHGLLKRELHNKVHACPDCRTCRVNFRELCPFCHSIDLDLERLIHHFACAYNGLESEFQSDTELRCPKCTKTLNQLGQDFDRPYDTYVCRSADHLFETPLIEAQCFSCGAAFQADELLYAPIFRYEPTYLTVRAVELNRLTGLDIAEVMFDADLRLNTREFFDLQAQRELLRMRRYGGSFCTAVLSFQHDGQSCAIFRDWSAKAMRDLGQMLVSNLRRLDIVARLDGGRLGLLLIEAPEAGTAVVRDRLMGRLRSYAFRTATGLELEPTWVHRVWEERDTEDHEVRDFIDEELQSS